MARTYTIRNSATHSTAITILQLTASSAVALEIIRCWVNQRGSTTSAQEVMQIVRKSSTATGTTGVTPVKHNTGDPSAVATAGHTATGEGSDSDIMIREGFNVLSGWLYLPVPEERIIVPPSGIIGLKFSTAPASQNWEYGMVFRELV